MGSGRIFRVLLVPSLGVLALAGCLQLLAIDGDVVVRPGDAGSVADAGPLSCGVPMSNASCAGCLSTSCCAELTACGSAPECARFAGCVLSCGDDYACRARCGSQNPAASFTQLPPLDVCVANHCQNECGVSCGLVESIVDTDAAVACQACLVGSSNCAAAEACGQSLDCTQVAQCEGACVTFDCQQACATGHDAGAALLNTFESTVAAACLTECQFGQSWGCVGHVAVPFATTPTVVTVSVITVEGAPVPGATVKACDTVDLTCASPLAVAQTDAAGSATLTVRGPLPVGDGFSGYFDIAPGDNADAGAPPIVPFLEFLPYPFTEPTALFAATAVTSADLANLTALSGVILDGGPAGDIALVSLDCGLHQASGVTFAATSMGLDLSARIRYISTATSVPSATSTSAYGIALLFEAPALENVTLTAIPTVLGHPSGTATAFVRSGALSIVTIPPQ